MTVRWRKFKDPETGEFISYPEASEEVKMAEQKTIGSVMTMEELEALVSEYEQARLREQAAKADKDKARGDILEAFKVGGMRTFKDSRGRATTVDSRITKRINYKEAEAMLDEDTLRKLTQETTYLVVNVRYKPQTEEERE